jgi:ATP:ADP antiporter, AAA family
MKRESDTVHAGYTTIALMLGGKWVFEHLGWGAAALATPLVMFAAGSTFFGLSLAASSLGVDSAISLLTIGAAAGAVTQVFARSSKFSLFDPAKEMVYIEMTKEEKSKGKAAVDLMGSQAGKTGASWIISGALLVFGSVQGCLPVLAGVYAVVIGTWVRSALSLKRLMVETELIRSQDSAAAEAADPEGGVQAAAAPASATSPQVS